MREILFRGKRKDNGEWIEGGYAEHDGKTFIVTWVKYNPDIRDWYMVEYYEKYPHYAHSLVEVDPETICQYTGLCDENGRKIFEWDIVEYEFFDGEQTKIKRASIKWCEDFHGFAFHVDVISYFCPEENMQIIKGIGIEVIGNIFDNPELL